MYIQEKQYFDYSLQDTDGIGQNCFVLLNA